MDWDDRESKLDEKTEINKIRVEVILGHFVALFQILRKELSRKVAMNVTKMQNAFGIGKNI